MDDKEAFEYVNRRKELSLMQDYLNKMVNSLNTDKFFKYADVKFSKSSNNFHFVERFLDRDLKIQEILPKFYQFILKNRCQVIFYCHLDSTDRAPRLEFEIDNVRMGMSFYNGVLSFRTIFEKYKNRHPGSIENFIISDSTHYYE